MISIELLCPGCYQYSRLWKHRGINIEPDPTLSLLKIVYPSQTNAEYCSYQRIDLIAQYPNENFISQSEKAGKCQHNWGWEGVTSVKHIVLHHCICSYINTFYLFSSSLLRNDDKHIRLSLLSTGGVIQSYWISRWHGRKNVSKESHLNDVSQGLSCLVRRQIFLKCSLCMLRRNTLTLPRHS